MEVSWLSQTLNRNRPRTQRGAACCKATGALPRASPTTHGRTRRPARRCLICVLGHEHCGAIEAAEQELDDLMHTITSEADGSLEAADAMDDLDEHIAAAESIILRQAGMSVWQAREAELDAHEDIERVHVAHIIETLVEQSPVIQQALAADKLMIVGARYQLDSGKVEVLSF